MDVSHLNPQQSVSMKYNVLFTPVTSGPSSQRCESYREFLIVTQTRHTWSSLSASAYITHSAQAAFHILFTAGELPPFPKQEDDKAIKLLLILTCLMKCNLDCKTFPELISLSFPASPLS